MKKISILLVACLALLMSACNLDGETTSVENIYVFKFSTWNGNFQALGQLDSIKAYFATIGMPTENTIYKGKDNSSTDKQAIDVFNTAKAKINQAEISSRSSGLTFVYSVERETNVLLASYSYP
jgi:hypothetical protein